MFALLGVAQYGAIDEADRNDNDSCGTLPENGFESGGRARFEGERGAVSGPSWIVLSFFFPSAGPALEQRVRDEATARGQTHPGFRRGLEIGMDFARKMIERARNDHFTDPWTGTVPTGPGKWINNGPPAGAVFGSVAPYCMTSGSQFRPGHLLSLRHRGSQQLGASVANLALPIDQGRGLLSVIS